MIRRPHDLGLVMGCLGVALFIGIASAKHPSAVLALSAVLPIVVVFARRPLAAALLAVGLVLTFENDRAGAVGWTDRLFEQLGVLRFSAAEILLMGALLSALLAHGRPRASPLALLALTAITVALVAGTVTGLAAGGSAVIVDAKVLLSLIVSALLVCSVVKTDAHLRRTVHLAAALVLVKGAEGALNVLLHTGHTVSGFALSYFVPGSNLILMLALLAIATRLVARRPVPWWILAAGVLAIASLALSERRSFWIGTVFGLAVVIVVASGRARGRVMLGVAALVGLAIAASVVGGGKDALVLTPSPTASANASLYQQIHPGSGDAYRNDERANVLREIRLHPVTGLGFGVGWHAVHPLQTDYVGSRNYVHMAPLWFWLKTGLLGPISYLILLFVGASLGGRIWRLRGPDAIGSIALSLAVGFAACLPIELTADFTGTDPRWTVVMGIMLGWLAVAATITPAVGVVKLAKKDS